MSLLTGRIFYEALKGDSDLMVVTGGRIYSTAIEIPPTDEDNTPLPYVILMSGNGSNDQQTKDSFEGDVDHIRISAEIAADCTDDVLDIAEKVRNVVFDYLTEHADDDDPALPLDYAFSWEGVAWDWTKPCHYMTLYWDCDSRRD